MRIAILALLTCCLAGQLGAKPRIWRDVTGRALTASYLAADAEHVFLKLDNGKTTQILLGLLSNEDLEFVRDRRAALKSQGILAEAPLVWEIYRSKNFTAAQAKMLGYHPLESDGGQGILRVTFQRYGPAPKKNAKVALRLYISSANGAGTRSRIWVTCKNKVVGSITRAPAGRHVDVPLRTSVLNTTDPIELTVRCGRDAVYIRTNRSGKGPRLVVRAK